MFWVITAATTNAIYYGTMVALIVYEGCRLFDKAKRRIAKSP